MVEVMGAEEITFTEQCEQQKTTLTAQTLHAASLTLS